MYISVELDKAFENAENINVYNDGKLTVYVAQSEEYIKILQMWNDMIEDAHQMPAFGVSLNRETVKALNDGLWVEFEFKKTYECDGMPFEKLLISVNNEHYGFNLIRYTSKYGYEGRCFYYDLVGKNMNNLYNLLLSI